MAQHARIEEVSDSSSASDSDPDVMDIDAIVPSTRSQSLMDPSQIPSSASQIPQHSAPQFDPSTAKKWICLYPLYFDATRSHKQGRRVGKEYAVENPLAKTMVDAVASFGLKVFFEPGKTHPKDWSNPGRARVELKDEGGKQKRNTVNNSMFRQGVSVVLELTQLSRSTSLHTRWEIPKGAPNNNQHAHGIPNTRNAYARRTSRTSSNTPRLEDGHHITST